MTLSLRLRAYAPGTDTHLGFLPEPLKVEGAVGHNADGALAVDYLKLADGGVLASRTLTQGLDVAVEFNAGFGWWEPDNCRYLMVDRDVDPTDPTKKVSLTFVSYSWLLYKVLNLNTTAVEGSKSAHAGMRKFTKKDAGDITKTFLDEHDGRPGNPIPIARDSWTATHDSLGAAWTHTKTVYYDVGQDLHSILDALAGQDWCDYRMRGRGLRIYNPDSAFTDRSGSIVLDYGTDLKEAPSSESLRDVVGRILVKGEGKKKVSVTGTTAPENYGRWEGFIDDGGVTDTDDLTADGNAELSAKAKVRGEYTRSLTMLGDFLPFRDYGPGDWITAPSIDGQERMRVQQVTFTLDGGALSGSVILNDRVMAAELARASKLSAVSGGAGSSVPLAGSGSVTQPAQADTRQAAVPSGFAVTPSLVLGDDRFWKASAGLSWSPVSLATDGTALDVAAYRVWAQPAGGEWRQVASTTAVAVALAGYVPGSQWVFAVTAVPATALWESAMSTQVSVTFPADTTPPVKPSAPVVVSAPSAVSVTWDGLDNTGSAQAADFAHVDVLMGTANPPTTVVGSLRAAGTYVGMAEIHSTQWISLVAYDTTGNESARTTPVSVVVKSVLDDTDLADRLASRPRFYDVDNPPSGTITEASWWLKVDGTVWKYVSGAWVEQAASTFDAVTAAQLISTIIAATSATIEDLAADSATIQDLYTKSLTAASAVVGTFKADTVQAGGIDGFIITGATVRTAASGARVELNSTGLHGYNSSGAEKTTVGTDGKLTAVDATLTGSLTTGTVSIYNGQVVSTEDSPVPTRVAYFRSGGLALQLPLAQVALDGYRLRCYSNGSMTDNYGYLEFDTYNGINLVHPTGRVYVHSGANLQINAAANVLIQGDTGVTVEWDLKVSGALRAIPGTTTSSANAYWGGADGSGYRYLYRSTSLRAAKACIETLDTAPADVLQLTPRTWYDRGEIVEAGLDPNAVTRDDCAAAGLSLIPGFIAEEVEQIDPRFCTYGATGELEGVAYDRISAALLVALQNVNTRLTQLEAK